MQQHTTCDIEHTSAACNVDPRGMQDEKCEQTQCSMHRCNMQRTRFSMQHARFDVSADSSQQRRGKMGGGKGRAHCSTYCSGYTGTSPQPPASAAPSPAAPHRAALPDTRSVPAQTYRVRAQLWRVRAQMWRVLVQMSTEWRALHAGTRPPSALPGPRARGSAPPIPVAARRKCPHL